MTGPSVWSQVGGLLLFALLVAGIAGAHRGYRRVIARRALRALVLPLPGRVRDLPAMPPGRAS